MQPGHFAYRDATGILEMDRSRAGERAAGSIRTGAKRIGKTARWKPEKTADRLDVSRFGLGKAAG
jgi:hypothetical protein